MFFGGYVDRGLGMELSWELVGGVRGWERRDAKNVFGGARLSRAVTASMSIILLFSLVMCEKWFRSICKSLTSLKTQLRKSFIKQYIIISIEHTAHNESNRENNNDLSALKYAYIKYQKKTYSTTDSS